MDHASSSHIYNHVFVLCINTQVPVIPKHSLLSVQINHYFLNNLEFPTPNKSIVIMKAIVALIFLGVVALSYAGVVAPLALGYAGAPLAYPYAYTAGYHGLGYNTLAGDYQLKLDTTLPGSAYANYPYAAAPTAYGYGVIKAL